MHNPDQQPPLAAAEALLRQTQQHIRERDDFHMADWSLCVAGHICRVMMGRDTRFMDGPSIAETAAAALGIHHRHNRLFYSCLWDLVPGTLDNDAKAAVRYIDYYIANVLESDRRRDEFVFPSYARHVTSAMRLGIAHHIAAEAESAHF